MRCHKIVREIKERYNYNLKDLTNKEMEEVTRELLDKFDVHKISTPIVELSNRMGFSVYDYPFEKEGWPGTDAFMGVGIEFSMNENSNFFLINKAVSNFDKRLIVAYMLSHYLLNINEKQTDEYNFSFKLDMFNDSPESRFLLCLMIPKNVLYSQMEMLRTVFELEGKYLTKDALIFYLSEAFEVEESVIEARLQMLRKK